jgi:hypothetical protein
MRLKPTSFDKKSYLLYVKGYMKKLRAKLLETKPDRVEDFERDAQAYIKKVIASFKDWEFYTGESMDPDGMVALLNYRDDGSTPFLVVFKDGLREVKCVCSPPCPLSFLLLWVVADVFSNFTIIFWVFVCGGRYLHTRWM